MYVAGPPKIRGNIVVRRYMKKCSCTPISCYFEINIYWKASMGGNFPELVEYTGKTFHRLLACHQQCHPKILQRKLLHTHKSSKFAKSFLPLKFPAVWYSLEGLLFNST